MSSVQDSLLCKSCMRRRKRYLNIMSRDSALPTLQLSLKFLPYKFTRNAEWRLGEQGYHCGCSSHPHNVRLGCMKNCWKGVFGKLFKVLNIVLVASYLAREDDVQCWPLQVTCILSIVTYCYHLRFYVGH